MPKPYDAIERPPHHRHHESLTPTKTHRGGHAAGGEALCAFRVCVKEGRTDQGAGEIGQARRKCHCLHPPPRRTVVRSRRRACPRQQPPLLGPSGYAGRGRGVAAIESSIEPPTPNERTLAEGAAAERSSRREALTSIVGRGTCVFVCVAFLGVGVGVIGVLGAAGTTASLVWCVCVCAFVLD